MSVKIRSMFTTSLVCTTWMSDSIIDPHYLKCWISFNIRSTNKTRNSINVLEDEKFLIKPASRTRSKRIIVKSQVMLKRVERTRYKVVWKCSKRISHFPEILKLERVRIRVRNRACIRILVRLARSFSFSLGSTPQENDPTFTTKSCPCRFTLTNSRYKCHELVHCSQHDFLTLSNRKCVRRHWVHHVFGNNLH